MRVCEPSVSRANLTSILNPRDNHQIMNTHGALHIWENEYQQVLPP